MARGGPRSVLMAQALPPIDLVNAIFVDYRSGKAVVSSFPEEESGTDHDFYLICCATAVRTAAVLIIHDTMMTHVANPRMCTSIAGDGEKKPLRSRQAGRT